MIDWQWVHWFKNEHSMLGIKPYRSVIKLISWCGQQMSLCTLQGQRPGILWMSFIAQNKNLMKLYFEWSIWMWEAEFHQQNQNCCEFNSSQGDKVTYNKKRGRKPTKMLWV